MDAFSKLRHLLGLAAVTTLLMSAASLRAAPGDRPDVRDAYGPNYKRAERLDHRPRQHTPPREGDVSGHVRFWNQVAYDASGLDHTPVAPGENRMFGEQFGPCRSSRAMAIVQIAVFDALNALDGGYSSFTRVSPPRGSASREAAIAQAAHDTLLALYPSQAPRFNALLSEDLSQIAERPEKTNGLAVGQLAAAAILALRANDGSQHAEPRIGIEFFTGSSLGQWQQDPISQSPLALGAHWGQVTPFVLQSGDQYRIPSPPALDSAEFAAAVDTVKRLGGDGVTTPTERTAEQTLIGIYWAYDGTPSLCAPTRMYNQITVHIATQMHTTDLELARLLALVNVSLADAAIAVWESKYFYQFWRPVTAIRALAGSMGDPTFTPLGAPASNLNGPNFTPPFPACPSGHAGFGGALFQTLRRFYRTDNIAFTFVSDELNGVTEDNHGSVRPLWPRTFPSLSAAEEENGQSRIYLGIHWAFDKTDGIAQGRQVADYVFNNAFQPVRTERRGHGVSRR